MPILGSMGAAAARAFGFGRIAEVVGDLYAFTSFTFTNAGVTGATGPSLANCLASYNTTANPWLNNTSYFNVTSGIQYWTCPATGLYTILAAGASGGGTTYTTASRGIIIQSNITLTKGTVYKILVGQKGGISTSAGGGGGTFMTDNSNTPVIIAGGGGGALNTGQAANSLSDATSGTTGNNSTDSMGTGGAGPNGGTGANAGWGGGGGGLTGNGTAGANASGFGYSGLGTSFTNGGTGGNSATTAVGGFGGGAGTHGNTGGGGGGGGYGGGGGSGQNVASFGGGGSSYSQASITVIGYNAHDSSTSGMGYLTIKAITSISSFFDGAVTYLSSYMSEFRNTSFYSYNLDQDAFTISDGGGDMYDGGNSTQLYNNGGTVTSNIAYNSALTTIDTDLVYKGLGYGISPDQRPLSLMAYRNNNSTPKYLGWQKTGNLGADGGGAQLNGWVHQGTTVNGFVVHAWYRLVYSAGDPSVCDFYMFIGHSNWNSSFGTFSTFAAASTDNNQNYVFTTNSLNIISIVTLLSKSGGAQVTVGEMQSVVAAWTSRLKTYLNY